MKYKLVILIVILFALLAVNVAQAGTEPDDLTCDLVGVRAYHCNENTAVRSDTCILFHVDVSFGDGTIIYWYMCNEYRAHLPVVYR